MSKANIFLFVRVPHGEGVQSIMKYSGFVFVVTCEDEDEDKDKEVVCLSNPVQSPSPSERTEDRAGW